MGSVGLNITEPPSLEFGDYSQARNTSSVVNNDTGEILRSHLVPLLCPKARSVLFKPIFAS